MLNLLGGSLTDNLGVGRVGSNVGVNSSPHLLKIIRSLTGLNVTGELLLVLFRVLGLEVLHVVGNVSSEDVLAEHGRVELLSLGVVTRETLVLVGDVETSVDGTLHGTEDTSTGGGEVESDIKENVERATTLSLGFNEVVSTIGLGLTKILLIKSQLSENTTGAEKAGGIGGGVVLLASLLVEGSTILR